MIVVADGAQKSFGPALFRRLSVGTAPILGVVAAAAWMVGLRPIDPVSLDGLGVIRELSPLLLATYPLLVLAVVIELSRPRPRGGVLAGLTLFGVVASYGLLPAIEPTARMPVGWLHAGFADYFSAHGETLRGFDARFSWPGFFQFIALAGGASGYEQTTDLLRWAPLMLGGLSVLGVYALAVAVLGSGRAAWLATWVYLVANWTEQEYFSPQATSYLLLLAALVLTVRHLLGTGLLDRPNQPRGFLAVPQSAPKHRIGGLAAVVVIAIALAPTHQLTPFVLAGFLAVFWLCRRLWAGWLPALALLAPVTWFAFGAGDFWSGRLGRLFETIGDLETSFGRNLSDRLSGDVLHQTVVAGRIAVTGVVVLLAVAGLYVAWRRGLAIGVLAAAAAMPFGMLALQPYGGEILIRCFLFALPFLALAIGILGAHLLGLRRWFARGAVWVVMTAIALTTLSVRGGNDAYVALTPQEVAAIDVAYDRARPGERVYAVFNQWPLLSGRVGEVEQRAAMNHCLPTRTPESCVRELNPEFLLVGPSQDAFGRIFYDYPVGWTRALVNRLGASGEYRVVFDERGALLAERTDR